MFEVNASWKAFYEELDPDRRRELYRQTVQEAEDDGGNALRGELLRLRHTDPKDPNHKVDNFIWQMVILPGYLRPMYFIRAVGEREIRAIIRELGLENAAAWSEAERAAAYWEYRNTAARYLTTCTGPAYAKKLFGTLSSSDEEKLARTARDFYSMTVTVPAKYGREQELELFTRALMDTFRSSSAAAERAWKEEEFRRRAKKR
jgi:hypothetical protein